jgi:hypothetical protein
MQMPFTVDYATLVFQPISLRKLQLDDPLALVLRRMS